MKNAVTVISREDGSGTRAAFETAFGIEETTVYAEITNSTAVMINTIMGDKNSVGYISLGSLNENIKILSIDGVVCSADNIKAGKYKICRELNLVTSGSVSETAKDFLKFSLSSEGQKIVEDFGYISIDTENQYNSSGARGKITLVGSSSVAPVIERIKEAYVKLNPDVSVEIQQNDSTTGVNSVTDGIADIGMVSRSLKPEELKKGIDVKKIATDGIAVIVNKLNPVDQLTAAQVNNIFSGKITDWEKIK